VVVDRQPRAALLRHHLPAPPGAEVEVAVLCERPAGGGAAEVANGHVRPVDRRDAGPARPQAQLHVLVEEERVRIERAERAELVGPAQDAGGHGPADGARALGAPRLEPGGEEAARKHRRHERPDPSGQRVRAVLNGPVGVQQPRGQESAARERVPGEPREPVVEQLHVRVHERSHVLRDPLDPRIAARAEAEVPVQADHLGAALGCKLRPAIARAAVHDDHLRPRFR
jgi:hypothetical protein